MLDLKCKSIANGILFLLLASSANAFQPSDGRTIRTQAERALRFNAFGSPIVDADARRINYRRDELRYQASRIAQQPAVQRPEAALGVLGEWAYAAFGSGIGKSNIVVASNGMHTEVYLGGSSSTFGSDNYWYALRYAAGTGDYEQVYVSRYYPTGISRIEVADIVADSALEILVALEDGRIELYDQASKTWLGEVSTAASGLAGLDIADVDGDGENELVVCTTGQLYVYSGSGALEWDLPGIGGRDVAVAQMDADGALEISVTNGQVVDAATQSVQWDWPAGFGAILEAADIDDDGVAELIAADAWYFVWAHDVDRQLPKWSIPVDLDIGAIHVADIDGDNVQELLIGEGQWGSVIAYDTLTQVQEWSIANPEHGVTDIAVGDLDGDGSAELLWGAGATSSGEDYFYVVDWLTQQLEWQSVHLDGPFVGPEIGDLDGDGLSEMVAVSWESDSGYGSGRILVFDGQDLRLRAISDEIVGGYAWTGTHDLKLRDVDHDGRLEILVAADRLYDGAIEIYDYDSADTFSLQWTNATQPRGAPFYSVDAADIDGDGAIEIIAGGGREHTGAGGVFVYVYDYATGEEEWHSLQMGDYWDRISALAVGDMYLDGSEDIIGMLDGGDVYVFDGSSKLLEAILPGTFTALGIGDVRGAPSIVLGDDGGDLSMYRNVAGSLSEIYRNSFTTGSIEGLSAGPGRRRSSWFIGSDGILTLARTSGTPLWQSASYGTAFGHRTAFLPDLRLYLSAGSYSIVGFDLRAR